MSAGTMNTGRRGSRSPREIAVWLSQGPAISVVAAIAMTALLIAAIAPNPGEAFATFLTSPFVGRGLGETLSRTWPIVALALAVAFALRAGVLNLGGEGQMVIGALAGGLVALFVPGPAFVLIPAAYLAAALAGGLWALASGLLLTRMGLPIFITSLLLNYPARALFSYLVRFPFKDRESSMIATPVFDHSFDIPALVPVGSPIDSVLGAIFGVDSAIQLAGRTTNVAILAVLLLLVGTAWYQRRTPSGYEEGMAGRNVRFAAYGGVNTAAVVLRAMFVSGAISGLVGAAIVFGTHHRLLEGALILTNYAWTAVLVALLAGSGTIALLVTGMAFAAIIVAGGSLQRATGVSAQIANVTQAILILLVSIRIGLPAAIQERLTGAVRK